MRFVIVATCLVGFGLVESPTAAFGFQQRATPQAAAVSTRNDGPGHASLARCRSRNPRGQRAENVALSIVEGSNPALPGPQLQPEELVVGRGALWVLSSAVRRARPGFDVESGDWGLKFPWFRVEPGALTVEGRRMDGPGTFHADLPPAGSYPPTGFMPSGLSFSNGGCWKITGKLRRTIVIFFIAFSSTHADICAQISWQLQNIAQVNNPHNDGLAQKLQADYQARGCSSP
jgi:hypothetical protein